nr:PREDICTED: E3 ubiquitin-protein ligase TRIM39-like isoform X1 [Lepisosteus oculatus]
MAMKPQCQDVLTKQQEHLKRQREAVKYRIKKLTAKQTEITKKSTAVRENISKKFEDIKRVLDQDLKVTLNQLEMEANAALFSIDNLLEKCNLVTQDIEMELSELNAQLEQNNQQEQHIKTNLQTEDRVTAIMNISFPDSIQLDDYKSNQILSLINNLFLFIRAQIPITRKVFESYVTEVRLDPDTAHPNLVISPDGTTATYTKEWQEFPESADRFDTTLNVISCDGFSDGRLYWEADVEGKTYWELGLTYPRIPRKGREETCWLGRGEESWCVEFFNGDYTAWHNGVSHHLPISKNFKKIGTYLSYPAGLISFYGIDDQTHLFTFCAGRFNETLHLAVCPGHDNEGSNTKPIKLCSAVKT